MRSSPCIVQQFIDTGQYPQKWRVLTLFGRPLYCNLSRSFAPRASLDAEDDVIESSIVDAKNEASKSLAGVGERRNILAIDEKIMNFATNIHSAFPQLPLLGVDILRRVPDGKLFAIVLNAGGTYGISPPTRSERARVRG